MQSEYLARLSEPVQEFIFEVEEGAGLEIKVILDSKLNERGPTGNGTRVILEHDDFFADHPPGVRRCI